MAATTMSAEQLLEACLGWRAWIETLVLTMPWFVSAGIFAIGQVYGSFLIQLFSLYLLLGHYMMLAINGGLNQTYLDPGCPANTMLGGLSHVTFYAVSVVFFVLLFHGFKRRYPGWSRSFMLLAALAIPMVLIWLGVRTPASVGVTIVVTIFLVSAFFAFLVGFNSEPQWLVRTGVVEVLHYTNFDLLLTPQQQKQLALDREVTKRVTRFCERRYPIYLHQRSPPPSADHGASSAPAHTVRIFG